MSRSMIPFNMSLLELTPGKLQNVGAVSSLDYFDNVTGEFHPEGLFSITMFGAVGDAVRKRRFGYIDIKLGVLHPVIYKALIALRRFYGELLAGRKYAIWDSEAHNFVEAAPGEENAGTGYHFFMQYWDKLVFTETRSTQRADRIAVIQKYRDIALTSNIVVLPAGLRDLEVGDDGRPVADEVNEFYRKLLSIANTIPEQAVKSNPDILDNSRIRCQLIFNELYEHLENLIKGKKKLFSGKWLSRRVHNSTRNVITSMLPSSSRLGDVGSPTVNHSVLGIYQTSVLLRPVTYYRLKNGVLGYCFSDPQLPARLVDPKTLEAVEVSATIDEFDSWMTDEGLTKTLSTFASPDIRHDPIMVSGNYLALIYTGQAPSGQDVFKVLHDIRELPEGFDKKAVRPITFTELLYLALYAVAGEYPIYSVRYPVAGVGSIYPSFIYLRSTTRAETRAPLNDQWEIDESLPTAMEYPILGLPFVDTASPNIVRLDGLTADSIESATSVMAYVYLL